MKKMSSRDAGLPKLMKTHDEGKAVLLFPLQF